MERQQPLGTQDLMQQHVDHAAVAEHGDGVVVVGGGDQVRDGRVDASEELGLVDTAGQLSIHQPLQLRRVLLRDLLDRDVVGEIAVVLGEALVDLDPHPQSVGQRLRGLDRAHLGAADHPLDREPGQGVGQPARLLGAFGGQVWIGTLPGFAA